VKAIDDIKEMVNSIAETFLPGNKESANDENSESSKPKKRSKVTVKQLEAAYESGSSFTDLLPWAEYIPECKQILMIDGYTRMACYELTPLPSEGRTEEYLQEAADNLALMLSESFHEHSEDPWVIQFYVNNEPDLDDHVESIKRYIRPEILETQFTQELLKVYAEHINDVVRKEGYFDDEAVTGAVWRGQMSRLRMTVYRKYASGKPAVEHPENELDDVCQKIESNLDGIGINFKRMDGEAFFWWMLLWFNPRPMVTNGNVAALHDVISYPGDEDLPIGSDLAESLTLSRPVASEEKGYLYFDGLPHAALQIISMKSRPRAGHLTAERAAGSTMLDKLPEGTVISYSLTVLAQDEVAKRITLVEERAMGDTAESSQKRKQAAAVLDKQAEGDKLYALEMVVYVRGEDDRDIRKKLDQANTQLTINGLSAIPVSKEVIALDNYVKNLPGVYTPHYDMKARRKAKPYFVSHAAALAPIYGRSRGSENPHMMFFNRTGEPTSIDPLNIADRRKNAHSLVFGPTGSGKSASLVWLQSCVFAIHRPRLVVIESGNSFGLWADWCSKNGATVAKNVLSMDSDLSIPPFANAMKLLKDIDKSEIEKIDDGDVVEQVVEEALQEDDDDDEKAKRDYLGEMELVATIMVQNGESTEPLSRAQRLALRHALLLAAENEFELRGGESIVTPADVMESLREISERDKFKHHASEILEMSMAMELFTDGLNGHLFNRREGKLWPDVDIQVVDLGQAVQGASKSTLAVAYVSLIQDINARIERDQMDDRYTLVLTDEAHLIYTDPLIPAFVMKAIKQWRKLGTFMTLATQNIEDFPGSSKRLLSMMEFWICLAMDKEEVDKISRFRDLNADERNMMINCTKAPGKYVEGVILSDVRKLQFRNVPPSLFLALAQTEKHEKAKRGDMIREHGLTGEHAELEAAVMVGEQIRKGRLEMMG